MTTYLVGEILQDFILQEPTELSGRPTSPGLALEPEGSPGHDGVNRT